MRACHPGPVALNFATISGAKRNVTMILPDAGRPRLPLRSGGFPGFALGAGFGSCRSAILMAMVAAPISYIRKCGRENFVHTIFGHGLQPVHSQGTDLAASSLAAIGVDVRRRRSIHPTIHLWDRNRLLLPCPGVGFLRARIDRLPQHPPPYASGRGVAAAGRLRAIYSQVPTAENSGGKIWGKVSSRPDTNSRQTGHRGRRESDIRRLLPMGAGMLLSAPLTGR